MQTENTIPAKKPIYKKWWFWVIAVIVLIAIVPKGNKQSQSPQPDQSGTQAESKQAEMTKSLPTVGQSLTTTYFEIKLNKLRVADRVSTGNQFADIAPEEGNRFIIMNVTFKNIDNESRMIDEGSLFITYNGKEYEFDKSETIMLEGWGFFLDQINPLTYKTTNIVYKIPAEIKGPVYWEPGRNFKDKRFFCGNL
jgi:hypothetical protein